MGPAVGKDLMVKNSYVHGPFLSHRCRHGFLVHSDKSGRDIAPTSRSQARSNRHELEQELDALAREYGVSKNKNVLEKMLGTVQAIRRVNKGARLVIFEPRITVQPAGAKNPRHNGLC